MGQVGDLQRLLEMYQRWQRSIFPHCEFDDFVVKLEKLSGTYVLKVGGGGGVSWARGGVAAGW